MTVDADTRTAEYQKVTEPDKPGWYIARMKTWTVGSSWTVVSVTRNGTAGPFTVWQIADHRPWPSEAWEWRAKIDPNRF